MKVLEIGISNNPGPYITEADEHVALVPDREDVAFILNHCQGITPLKGDVTGGKFGVKPESFDLVIAREIFGSSDIGVDPRFSALINRKLIELKLANKDDEYNEIAGTMAAEDNSRKNAIARAAIAATKSSGYIVFIETFTPPVARGFMQRWNQLDTNLKFDEVLARSVLPEPYVAHHEKPWPMHVWTAVKQ